MLSWEAYEQVEFVRAAAGAIPTVRWEEAESIAEALTFPALQSLFLRETGRRRAGEDVQAAVAWAAGLPEGAAADGAWEGVFEAWAETDAEALLGWSETHASEAGSSAAVGKLCRTLATENPREAVHFAAGLSPSSTRTRALIYGLGRWAAQDLEAAAEWTAETQDENARSLGLAVVAQEWSRRSPEAAQQWVGQSGGSPDGVPAKAAGSIMVPQ